MGFLNQEKILSVYKAKTEQSEIDIGRHSNDQNIYQQKFMIAPNKGDLNNGRQSALPKSQPKLNTHDNDDVNTCGHGNLRARFDKPGAKNSTYITNELSDKKPFLYQAKSRLANHGFKSNAEKSLIKEDSSNISGPYEEKSEASFVFAESESLSNNDVRYA